MGIRGNDLAAIDAAGLDRKVLAARGADAVLKMILVDGFFHADPHPGNVMYLPGNRIALIDFGMVGRLSPARRSQIVDLLAGLARHDEEAMLEVLLDWRGDDAVDEARLAADLGELAFDYADVPLKDLKIGCCCTGSRRSCASTRSCCRPISRSCSRRSSPSRGSAGSTIRSSVWSNAPSRFSTAPCGSATSPWRPCDAARRHSATSLALSRRCRAILRGSSKTRGMAACGSSSTSSALTASAIGSTARSTASTVGIMTASLVIGSSIVMTVPGGPTLFGMSLLTLVRAGGLSDCIREQPLDHPVDLALRPALTPHDRADAKGAG